MALKKSNVLSKSFQEELRKFAQDTATKTEVVIALKNSEIIFEKGYEKMKKHSKKFRQKDSV